MSDNDWASKPMDIPVHSTRRNRLNLDCFGPPKAAPIVKGIDRSINEQDVEKKPGELSEPLAKKDMEKGAVPGQTGKVARGGMTISTSGVKGGYGARGGPGRRGGVVIGYTKSGLPIYASHKHKSHSRYTKEDHADAAALHGQQSSELDKDSFDSRYHDHISEYHKRMSQAESKGDIEGALAAQKKAAMLRTRAFRN